MGFQHGEAEAGPGPEVGPEGLDDLVRFLRSRDRVPEPVPHDWIAVRGDHHGDESGEDASLAPAGSTRASPGRCCLRHVP